MKFDLNKFKAGVSAFGIVHNEHKFIAFEETLVNPLVFKWRSSETHEWMLGSSDMVWAAQYLTMKSEPVIRWAVKVSGSRGVDFWHNELSDHNDFCANDVWKGYLVLKTKKIILESDDEI